MENRKKRIGFISSSTLVKTGFSASIRRVLNYLYPLDKYELFHLHQGMIPSPDLERTPWKSCPGILPHLVDQQKHSSDEAYRRYVSYANPAVSDFVINNKLDVLFHIEDIWSSDFATYTQSKWWPLLKNNFVNWTTADSLTPGGGILENFREWAKAGKVWFWSSFAEKSLLKENTALYGPNIKTVPGAIDDNEYTPLLKTERDELRKQFGIDPNTVIFMQLGRNQLRKLFPFTIECFAKFKKQNPKANAKLLFHTSWSEGWNLPQLIKDNKIDPADVLCSYFCSNCNKWFIHSFIGEQRDCPSCLAKGSVNTAGITSTISNEDISKIYNISDAVISLFTSGGLEYTNLEALLCGMPLACSDYSCGEDFCANDFVFPVDGNLTYEVGTNFLKHVPNRNTVVKFMEKIYNMTHDERKKFAKPGRQWVIDNYSTEVICSKIMEFIDSRPLIDWNTFDPESQQLKNPDAVIDDISDNGEWVKHLYSRILNMTVDDKDSGYIYWITNLTNGATRQNVVDFFRKTAFEENAKILSSKPKDFSELLDNTGRKRLAFILPESLGDVLWLSSLFKDAKDIYPDYDIYLATKPGMADLLEGNPYLHKVIPYFPQMENLPAMEGQADNKGYFDIAFLPHITVQRQLGYLHNGQDKISFDIIK